MKNVKISLAVIITLCTVPALFAQTNMGVDYYLLGDYGKAKRYLEQQVASDPVKANFYLGETAFAEGNMQKAEEYYNASLKAGPDSFYGRVGLAKLKLKSDAKAAGNMFGDIMHDDKKNIEALLAIGRAYLDCGMLQQAGEYSSDAEKLDSKNPAVYILEGDILKGGKEVGPEKAGEVAGKYEMANYFDPAYALAYVKSAQMYESVNPSAAIEKLKTATQKQPDYIIAYGMLGRIYTRNGSYQPAIEAYKTYFNSKDYSIDDIELYARANYFSDNFEQAEKIVEEGLQSDPEHFVLNRYRMYIDAKTDRAEQGLQDADKFFALRADSGYIALDYSMYAKILAASERYDEAFAQYDKAIALEPDNMDVYAEAIEIARKNRDYALAAGFLKKQMAKKAGLSGDAAYQDDVVDINALGYDYYSAGVGISKNTPLAEALMKNKDIVAELSGADKNADPAKLASDTAYFALAYSSYYLHKADSVFNILIERLPDSYSGYRFKALTQHALNPDTEAGMAKPYYEKVVEIITKGELNESSTKVLLEAYNYLGYYYYMKSDKPNTVLYWGKVLELDPDNANAKLVLAEMNK